MYWGLEINCTIRCIERCENIIFNINISRLDQISGVFKDFTHLYRRTVFTVTYTCVIVLDTHNIIIIIFLWKIDNEGKF